MPICRPCVPRAGAQSEVAGTGGGAPTHHYRTPNCFPKRSVCSTHPTPQGGRPGSRQPGAGGKVVRALYLGVREVIVEAASAEKVMAGLAPIQHDILGRGDGE